MAKVLISLLLITNFIYFNSAEFNFQFGNDEIYNLQKLDGSSLLNFRKRRDTKDIDLSTKYKSNVPDPTKLTTVLEDLPQLPQLNPTPKLISVNKTDVMVEESVAVNDKQLHLLGVNGTGQRKDIVKPPMIPTIVPTKKSASVKKVQSSYSPPILVTDPMKSVDDFLKDIDISEEAVEHMLSEKKYTLNSTEEHHTYYNSTIFVDKVISDNYWDSFKNITSNNMLSTSHRRAMTVQLSFDFPFYGNPVRNVTVATGGFLYTGEYVHSWLAATQYIAPLMANFDSSLSNTSLVRYSDNGTAFTVIWENVYLQDKRDVGPFTFSTTLQNNGDIIFTYFSVPIPIEAIEDSKHPVKVGLSDAYIIDKVIFFARRKTIYEYHRVNFGGIDIKNNTIIYLKALPTCLGYTTCQSCLTHHTNFDCSWCPSLNKCSIGTDRKRQDWLQKGCDRTQIKNFGTCPAIGTKGNDSNRNNSNESTEDNHSINNNANINNITKFTDRSSRKDTSAEDTIMRSSETSRMSAATAAKKEETKSNVGLVIGLMIPICLIMTILIWVFYAYRNPHTKSGQLLIQTKNLKYRPSHWSWRRGEARYTAATIHM